MDQAACNQQYPKKLKPFLIQIVKKSKKSTFNKEGSSQNSSFCDDGKKMGKWSKEEDEMLLNAVTMYGTKNWKLVSNVVSGRNQVQCLHRWTKILQPGLTKGPWSIDEDRKLLQWVKREGACRWTSCAEFIKGRSGKQCRERWLNTLNPNVKKGGWEPEEDFMIFKLFSQFGSQWSKISMYFEKRTENSIKNRFYSTLRRIAAEKKKDEGTEEEKKRSKSKLDSLLQFVPDAINEKSQKIMTGNNHPGVVLPSENIIIVDYEKNNSTDHEEELEIKMPLDKMEKKISSYSTEPSQNNNNLSYNNNSIFDDNTGVLENDISNFLDSFFDTSANEKNCNFSFLHNEEKFQSEDNYSYLNVNNDNINDNNLNTMVDQLSSLEELLQNTKNKILSGSEQNQFGF
jgi:hypothetical protein